MEKDIDGIHAKPKSKIEVANEKLYSNYVDIKEKPRSHMHREHFNVSDDWQDEQQKTPFVKQSVNHVPIFRKFFIGAAIFFLAAIVFALISLFVGKNMVSTDSIDMQILTRSFVDGGQELDVTVQVINKNTSPLELADLVLSYPKSSVSDVEIERDRRSLGTVAPGETAVEDFSILLFGEEGEERQLQASLEYRVEGSNAIFVKETDTLVAIQSTPLQVAFDAPDTSVTDQTVSFDMLVTSQATSVIENMLLSVEYPTGFTFTSAEPAPDFGNHTWNLGDLDIGAKETITITGNVAGSSGDEQVFRSFVGRQDPRQERVIQTIFNTALHTIRLENSFVVADVAIDNKNKDRVPVNSGDLVPVKITWQNTSGESLSDVTIIAQLSGSAYDPATVKSNRGFFDSTSDTIIWTPEVEQDLQSVDMRETGTLFFEFEPRPLITGSSIIDQPEIVIDVHVEGIDPTGDIRSAENIAQGIAVVNSDLQLTQRTQYYGGLFENSGPYPPQVDNTSTMTITWQVTNSSNLVDNTTVTATLPVYVDWLNRVSPSNEDVDYNTVKREVTWDLGEVVKGTGFSSEVREISFQVGITPSLSQLNNVPALTSDVVLVGEDQFTDVLLRIIRNGHSTKLLNDVQSNFGRVAP